MDKDRVRIADVITTEYSDFLSFCSASGKIFISELTNVDFVAFSFREGKHYCRTGRKKFNSKRGVE